MLSRKLKDLGIRNFEELHKFGVQKESDLAQDKKYFSSRPSSGREGAGSSSASGPSHNIQINAVQPPVQTTRRFSDLGRSLSNVFKKLVRNNAIHPLPQRPPYSGVDHKFYCKYHQNYGHDTDDYVQLRHEVQNLIKARKIIDPKTRKPNTRNNPLPNYHNVPPPNPRILMINTGLTEEQVLSSFVDTNPTIPKPSAKHQNQTINQSQQPKELHINVLDIWSSDDEEGGPIDL